MTKPNSDDEQLHPDTWDRIGHKRFRSKLCLVAEDLIAKLDVSVPQRLLIDAVDQIISENETALRSAYTALGASDKRRGRQLG